MACLALAKLHRTMLLILTPDNRTRHSLGPFLSPPFILTFTRWGRVENPFIGCTPPDLVVGHTLSVGEAAEPHCRPGAVGGCVGAVEGGVDDVEVCHMDLETRGADAAVVVLVDPGAVGFVVLVVDDYV